MSTALQLTSAEQALGISLPNRRMEDWRWTDLRARLAKSLRIGAPSPSASKIDAFLKCSPIASMKCKRVVFVNGKLDKSRSDTKSLVFSEVAPNEMIDDPVIELNMKISQTRFSLVFEGNVSEVVEIIHVGIGNETAFGSRIHYEVARNSSAFVVETFVGEGSYLNSSVISATVHDNARLDRLKLELESPDSQHLAHAIYWLGKGSQLNDVSVTIGSSLTRQNGTCNFLGQNAEAKISGAYLLKGKQHADTCLVINHAVPNCTSRELFKCVMDDNARGIFQGKVVVAKHAQKTDGKQSSHALLLSESAEFDAKPELEIYADDVVCGHGATAGDLNHDHLFYLKSRGIPEAEAKSLLIAAFVGEAFDMVANDEVREALAGIAAQWVTGK